MSQEVNLALPHPASFQLMRLLSLLLIGGQPSEHSTKRMKLTKFSSQRTMNGIHARKITVLQMKTLVRKGKLAI